MKRIELKSASELRQMRAGGKLLASVFERVSAAVRPGITTKELDQIAYDLITGAGAVPAFLGYHGFTGTLCTSVNDEVVHGIPGERVLEEGDIISVDCGLILNGFVADMANTFPVGRTSPEAQRLIDVTRQSFWAGCEQAREGNRLGDLSAAVQRVIEEAGYSVVRDYSGHGIGRSMHEPPQVPNYGDPGTGLQMKAGLVIAVEPMVNIGTWRTRTLDDEWTVVTADGSLSAHYEHSIAVTPDGPVVLTAD